MATPTDNTAPVDETATPAPELKPVVQDLAGQDSVEVNTDADPNDPRLAPEVPAKDEVPASAAAPAPADTSGTVEQPAQEAAKPDVASGVPANAAAVHTAEGVEQHLDVDPNDPRNVPQPSPLPNFTDADQQGPAKS